MMGVVGIVTLSRYVAALESVDLRQEVLRIEADLGRDDTARHRRVGRHHCRSGTDHGRGAWGQMGEKRAPDRAGIPVEPTGGLRPKPAAPSARWRPQVPRRSTTPVPLTPCARNPRDRPGDRSTHDVHHPWGEQAPAGLDPDHTWHRQQNGERLRRCHRQRLERHPVSRSHDHVLADGRVHSTRPSRSTAQTGQGRPG